MVVLRGKASQAKMKGPVLLYYPRWHTVFRVSNPCPFHAFNFHSEHSCLFIVYLLFIIIVYLLFIYCYVLFIYCLFIGYLLFISYVAIDSHLPSNCKPIACNILAMLFAKLQDIFCPRIRRVLAHG